MFAEPTINDFVELIDWHIANALKSADRAVNGVRGEFKAGVFQSGRRIIFSIEAARKEFEAGVEAVLGELKRTIRKNKLDPKDLRQHAGERLLKFANDAKAAAKVAVWEMSAPSPRSMNTLNSRYDRLTSASATQPNRRLHQ